MMMMIVICKLNTIGDFYSYVDDSHDQLCGLSSNLSCAWNQDDDDDVSDTSSISGTPTNLCLTRSKTSFQA